MPAPKEERTTAELWDAFNKRIEEAAAAPGPAKFRAVGQAAVEWAQSQRVLPRDVTSLSASETPLYNEILGEAHTFHHVRSDHLGFEHGTPECKALEQTPLGELPADAQDA